MDTEIIKQVLDELFSSFEDIETRSAAVVLLLKDQGTVTEEALLPYLEQAGKTSNVRWRAARVRIGALLESAMKVPEPEAKPKADQQEDVGHHQEKASEASRPTAGAQEGKARDSKTDTKDNGDENKIQTEPEPEPAPVKRNESKGETEKPEVSRDSAA